MKQRAPAFQFYPRQFAGDDQVMGMDLEAIGAHILLMCAAAASPERCRIDAEEYAIRMRLRNPSDEQWQSIKKQLLAGAWKVSEDGKWWIQTGLERTFQKQKDFSEQQRERANSKWSKKDAEVLPETSRTDAEPMPGGMPKECSSSSSSSSNHKPSGVMPDACRTDAELMPDASRFNSTDVAQILCRENFWSGRLMIEAVKASIEFKSTEMPECSLEQVGEWLAMSYIADKAEKGERAADPLKYFQQAMYPHSSRKMAGATHLSVNDPAAYARAAMEGD
jgi:uncharacterized protein YdaU (DUF1376 family)